MLALFLGIFGGTEPWYIQYLLLGSIVCFTVAFLLKNYWFLLIALFCLGNTYGQYRSYFDLRNDQLPQYYYQTVSMVGVIDNFPDIREKNNRVFVRIVAIDKKQVNHFSLNKNLGRVLLIYDRSVTIDYGNIIEFTGKVQAPRKFEDFDYPKYLKRFEIQSIVKNPENIKIVDHQNGGNFFVFQAKRFRNILSHNLETHLPPPHNQIAMGILLGVKKELPKLVSVDFKNSGLQHILVVSGFNVTILIIFVTLLLKRFGRIIVFIGGSFSLLFFLVMVGFDPPVLRATIFGIIVGWAIFSGRFSDSRNLLFLTAVVLAIYSPPMIQQDIGFFLSFFATLGIILGVPVGLWFFDFITHKFELRTIISVIVTAQVSVFPILGLTFGTFPVIGFFANLFVEPLIPLAMFFSFCTLLIPSSFPTIGAMVSLPAYICLNTILFFAHFFGAFEPLKISQNAARIGLIFVLIFFVWGSFSTIYQQKFLEVSKKKS